MMNERADISRSQLVRKHTATGLDYESFARWLRVGAVAFALGASAFAAPAVASADTSDSGSSSTHSAADDAKAGDGRTGTRSENAAPSRSDSPKRHGPRTRSDDPKPVGNNDSDDDLAEEGPSDDEPSTGHVDGSDSGSTTPAPESVDTGSVLHDQKSAHTRREQSASSTPTPVEQPVGSPSSDDAEPIVDGSAVPQTASTSAHVAPLALRSSASATTVSTSATAVSGPASVAVRQSAAVTLNSIFTDIMHWIGLGSLSANLPVPASPVPMFVESLWLFVRNVNYTLNNQRPTAAPTTSGPGLDGTITGDLNAVDYDDGNLTYTVTAAPGHGTVTVDSTGHYIYTPAAGTTALFDTFTITVDDEPGNAPHISSLVDLFTNISPQDTIVTVSLTGAPLPTIGRQSPVVTLGSIISDALHWIGWGRLADRLTLPTNPIPGPLVSLWNAVREFQYTWNNQRATANPVIFGQATNGTVTGALNAVDYDDAVPVYTVEGQPQHGVVSVDANGNFTYTPDAATAALGGVDRFTVIINDNVGTPTHFRGLLGFLGLLGPRRTTVVVQVNPVLPSTAGTGYTAGTSDPSTGATSGSVTVNNPTSGPLTYTLGSGAPTRGTVTVDPQTGAFTYTPTEDARHAAAADGASAADKLDSFSVTVTDGYHTITVPVSLNILGHNTNPTVAPSGTTITDPSNGAVTGAVSVTDADGDTPRYTGPTTSTKGGTVTVNPTTGAYTYTPSAEIRHAAAADGADQTDTFTIMVSDGHGGTIAVPVTVGISTLNTAPTAGTPTVTNVNGGSGVVTGSVGGGSDADGDIPSYTGPTTSTKGGTVTVNPTTGAYTYTPTTAIRHAAAANGATTADQTDTFTITISDGHGGVTVVPVSVAIVASNAVPVAGATVTGLNHSTGAATGTITGSDADGDTAVFGGPVTSTKGGTVTIDPVTGAFTYTPTAAARHAAAALGASPADLVDSFTATVSDGYGGTTSVVVVIALSATNTGPTSGSATVGAPSGSGGSVTGTVSVVDPDNDIPIYSAPGTSTKGGTVTIDPSTGTYVYTPSAAIRHAAAANGATTADQTDTFTITVSDGHGGTIAVPVSVTVSPSNTAPSVSTSVGSPSGSAGTVTGTVNVTDGDNDTPLITGPLTSTKGGTVTIDPTTGAFTYTPTAAIRHAAAANGADQTDTFTITVDDGHGGTTTLAVTVNIDPTNTAPTVNTTVGTPSGAQGTVTGTVNVTDSDNDTPLITGPLTSTKGGTVTIDPTTGAFTYTPTTAIRHAAAANGAPASTRSDTFDLTVDDGHGGTTVVTISVAIDPANSAPTAVANVNAPSGSNGAVTGSIIVTDADQDTPVYSGSTTTALGGTVTVNTTTGTFSYTPTAAARHNAAAANAPASALNDTFNVTISDGHGGTYVVPVSVVVSPSNTAPTGTASINTFPNGDFSNSLTGWTAINSRVKLGGAGTVAGWPTPVDPTRAPDGGIESTGGTGTYTTTVTNGRAVMQSNLGGVTNTPVGSGGVVHGPVVVSNDPVAIYAGATVQFDWEASGGADAFDVVGYIVDVDTGRTEIMLNATGANASTAQPVTVVNYLVTTAGNYRFVFVAGTWDATQGEAAGAKLSIDNVKVLNNNNPTGVVNGAITGSDANGDALTYSGPTGTDKGTVTLDPATGSFSYTPTAAARAAATAAGASAADKSDTFIIMIDDGHGGLTPVSVTVPIT